MSATSTTTTGPKIDIVDVLPHNPYNHSSGTWGRRGTCTFSRFSCCQGQAAVDAIGTDGRFYALCGYHLDQSRRWGHPPLEPSGPPRSTSMNTKTRRRSRPSISTAQVIVPSFRRGVAQSRLANDYAIPKRVTKLSRPAQDLYVQLRQHANDKTAHMYDDECPWCGATIARHFMLRSGVRVLTIRTGTTIFDRFRFRYTSSLYDFEFGCVLDEVSDRFTKAMCPEHGFIAVYPFLFEDDDPRGWTIEGAPA